MGQSTRVLPWITVLVYHSVVYASDSLCIHSSHTILTPWRQVSPCRMRYSLDTSPTLRLFDDSDAGRERQRTRARDSGADAVLSLACGAARLGEAAGWCAIAHPESR